MSKCVRWYFHNIFRCRQSAWEMSSLWGSSRKLNRTATVSDSQALTHCFPGHMAAILNVWISSKKWRLISLSFQINFTMEWTPEGLVAGKWTPVQIMVLYRLATGHYLNHFWPRSPTPCGDTGHNELTFEVSWECDDLSGHFKRCHMIQN